MKSIGIYLEKKEELDEYMQIMKNKNAYFPYYEKDILDYFKGNNLPCYFFIYINDNKRVQMSSTHICGKDSIEKNKIKLQKELLSTYQLGTLDDLRMFG